MATILKICFMSLQTLETFGSCQRPVFSLGVFQHNMHKITNLLKFRLNWSSMLRDNNGRKKNTLSHEVVCCQMLDFGTSKSNSEVSKSNSWKIILLSRKLSYFRGSRFSQCLYYQPLPITRYQVSFYAAHYFE